MAPRVSDMRPIGSDCPYCGGTMTVSQMSCDHCKLAITAAFPMSRLGGLPVEHQRFIEMFVLAGGNLKEIAEQVGVSYPTIRSRLDKVIDLLRGEIAKTRQVKGNVLDALGPSKIGSSSSGRATAEEAARIIKEI